MATGIIIAQLLLQYGPGLASAVANILHDSSDPVLAQWNAVFAQVRTYDQIVAPPTAAPAVGAPTVAPQVGGA